jgi:hypothetical protein
MNSLPVIGDLVKLLDIRTAPSDHRIYKEILNILGNIAIDPEGSSRQQLLQSGALMTIVQVTISMV